MELNGAPDLRSGNLLIIALMASIRGVLQVGGSYALNDHTWHGVYPDIRLNLAGGTLFRLGTDALFTVDILQQMIHNCQYRHILDVIQ